MTKNELNDAYFNWMYQLVFDGRYSKRLSYRKAFKRAAFELNLLTVFRWMEIGRKMEWI